LYTVYKKIGGQSSYMQIVKAYHKRYKLMYNQHIKNM
jgi:hypothetical protein